jgi:hypothetical protein
MEQKTCLLVYVGNGYSEGETSYYNSYIYSVDMRENKENHHKNIIKPLEDLGYKVDTTLVTNKHKRYDEFVEEYNAIRLDYSDITQQEYDNLYSFYAMKTPQQWGCGSFRPGGRFLKMRGKFPEYDLYVFLRGDTILKKSLNDMNVDYEKINYLWKETDYRFFTGSDDIELADITIEWPWETYKRVSGNILNIVDKKHINVFLNYYWLEHMSLFMMTRELYPIITYENDINLICGENSYYASAVEFCENPIYTFNKKILEEKNDFKYKS